MIRIEKSRWFLMISIDGVLLVGNSAGYLYAQTVKVVKSDNSKEIPSVELDYKAQEYRDPFESNMEDIAVKPVEPSSSEYSQIKAPVLVIQGIFWGGQFAQAIIDNMVVKEGDHVKGATITSITRDKVEILFEGRDFTFPTPAGIQRTLGNSVMKTKKTVRPGAKKGKINTNKSVRPMVSPIPEETKDESVNASVNDEERLAETEAASENVEKNQEEAVNEKSF